jgi:lipopolysaccharide transport system permease protein
VFPLEILAAASVGSALFHALTSLLILIVFEIIAFHYLPATFISLPLVWLPLVLGSLGCTLLLSAAGVYLRDINQVVAVLLNMLMFVSPIFFPLSALPKHWLPVLQLNPIAHVIESTRIVTVAGKWPGWQYLIFGIVSSFVLCEVSFRVFRSAKPTFADVM